ncbi:calcium uptake protein 3, mitochondrial [Plakobranchus ocellatus]|uniref:Calcium uptake protein 3, mitochondrial n=1 Tax=Plakobranchus ocellatus TaxID=259542 RepID=A0AAV4AQY1_9GAST|nr:calcium uptake protein 3, mitochondrial [Plakobranchus ocellatus]
MAAHRSWQRILSSVLRKQNSVRTIPTDSVFSSRSKGFKLLLIGAAGLGSFATYQAFRKADALITLPAVQAAKDEEDDGPEKSKETNYREMRFRQFASVEYDGSLYMTPQDFLESVTEESPRGRD